MVICVGQAPVLGACRPRQHAVGRVGIRGRRRPHRRPIELVNGPLTGLPIPAEAELVFEGYMPPPEEETRPEGPFGEWPGYYASETRPEPVLHVKAIYHRNDPIVVGQPPAKPTYPGRQTNFAERRRACGMRSRRRACRR